VSSACLGALDGAIAEFRSRAAAHVGKHGAKTAEDVNAQQAVSEAMMTSDQLKLVLFRNYARIVECARSDDRMPVEERLMQRAQAAQVPKQCAAALSELMRACAASGTYKSNPIERIFRDIHQARGHIANNTDTYARIHGAVMLGLSNRTPSSDRPGTGSGRAPMTSARYHRLTVQAVTDETSDARSITLAVPEGFGQLPLPAGPVPDPASGGGRAPSAPLLLHVEYAGAG
jgi:hypothetical protein